MRAYMNRLNAELAAQQAAQEQKRAQEARAVAQAARERLVPLDARIARLLAGIPPEVQAEGLSLMGLQAQLRGRWRGNAHPGEIGDALRRLGFRRERRWRGGADGFRAVWRRAPMKVGDRAA